MELGAVVTYKVMSGRTKGSENGTRVAHRVVVRDTKGLGSGEAGGNVGNFIRCQTCKCGKVMLYVRRFVLVFRLDE